MMRRALILFTLAAVLLSGCGGGAPPDSTATATWDATSWNESRWAE
jgi:ABC-type glycerol-3-phosphate transport system substrate-binding protein